MWSAISSTLWRFEANGCPGLLFAEFSKAMRDTVVGAITHGQIPFPEIVKRLGLSRDAVRALFSKPCLRLSANRSPGNDGSQNVFEYIPLTQQAGQFDVNVEVTAIADSLAIEFRYDRSIFERSTMQRMANHYATLLQLALAAPDRPVGDLAILTDAEWRQIRTWATKRRRNFPSTVACRSSSHEVERTPDAVAVQLRGQYLTYQELNARAIITCPPTAQVGHRTGCFGRHLP